MSYLGLDLGATGLKAVLIGEAQDLFRAPGPIRFWRRRTSRAARCRRPWKGAEALTDGLGALQAPERTLLLPYLGVERTLEALRAERYAGWDSPQAQAMLHSDLGAIFDNVVAEDPRPVPRSGRQERLANLVNRFV